MDRIMNLFVSPAGRDTAAGDELHPLATLHAARDRARRDRAGRPVRIVLRGGTHVLAETLVLTPEDSGSADAPVTFCAYPGEQPIVSGGTRVTGWTEGTHAGRRCWIADLPEVRAGTWDFQQLFVGGRRRPRTRLPKTGYYRFVGASGVGNHDDKSTGTFGYAPGELSGSWHNLTDVKVTAIRYWLDLHLPIASVDAARHEVTFTPRNIPSLVDEKGQGSRYWVENVFEALEEPGQWYLDRPTGRLYYLPMDGETIEGTDVVAPRLATLVRIDGGSNDHDGPKVRYVRFENLGFRHAEWALPRVNWGAGQAQYFFPGAIILRGAEHCAFYGCELANVSQYGIEVQRGSRHNRVVACTLHDVGAGAVKVNSENLLRRWGGIGPDVPGVDMDAMGWGGTELPDDVIPGMYTTVSDCEIRAVGRVYPSCCAILILESARNRILHNHIHDTYYTAISIGWNWGYMHTRVADNRVEYNHIHDVGQGVLSDLGCVYLLGIQPGTRIANNVIHDVNAYGYGGGGIYPDEGSSYMTIENNVTYRSGGVGMHYGRDNVVRNNVFIGDGHEGPVGLGRAERYRSMVLDRNIVYARGSVTSGAVYRCGFDRNIYWNPAGPVDFGGETFEQWRGRGFDARGIVADPLLTDPTTGNVTLRADSPALKMGFVPIDTRRVGPRFGGSRPASIDDLPPEEERPRTIVETRLEFGQTSDYLTPTTARDFPVRYVDVTEPIPCCLMIRNCGETRATGRIEIRVSRLPNDRETAPAGRVEGPAVVEYDLAANERKNLDFVVHVATGTQHCLLETIPAADGTLPSALHLTARPTVTIRKLRDDVPVDGVAGALANEPPFAGRGSPQGVCEMRFGLTDTHVLVHARIRDTLLQRGGAPWSGTCFELFTASPGTNGRTGNMQLFLRAPAGGEPAVAIKMGERVAPAPEIELHCTTWSEGYELQARVPLETARLTPGLRKFPFEAYATVVNPGDSHYSKYSLFGDANGNDNGGWAMAEVIE